MKSDDFKSFWENQVSPVHAHSSDDWFDRYAQEILTFLAGSKTIVDAGCGSGEILERIAPLFSKVYAIDYSEAMLEKAKERAGGRGYANIHFNCDSIVNIGKHCSFPVDAIYSNGVIQYLSLSELDEFLQACRNILRDEGKIALLNIPNINSRILFLLGFYKHEKQISFFRVLKGLIGLWLKVIFFKLKHGFKKYDDGIGNWFSIDQMRDIGRKHGFEVEIFGASVVNYYYRFHVVLIKKFGS